MGHLPLTGAPALWRQPPCHQPVSPIAGIDTRFVARHSDAALLGLPTRTCGFPGSALLSLIG